MRHRLVTPPDPAQDVGYLTPHTAGFRRRAPCADSSDRHRPRRGQMGRFHVSVTHSPIITHRTAAPGVARRHRVAVHPVALAAAIVVMVSLFDTVAALAASPDVNPTPTTLALLLAGDVLVLGGAALLGARAVSRWRAADERDRAGLTGALADADLLRKVIDNTSAVIYMRDGDGRYLLVNRQYEQLFGVRRQDIVGLTDHDLFPAALADDFRTNDLKALDRGAPMQAEEIAPHPDGPHTYITVKYPILGGDGRGPVICGISTDITEVKRAEARVRQLNTELEERVRERTAELEASTRELDAFAYSVSHDLRAPLRAVAGFSELILEDYGPGLDETGRGYLRRALSATDRMGQLIDDLLNLSRTTRAELTRQTVDLSLLAHGVVADLAGTAPERDPCTEVEVADGLRTVGDPALLELVVQNLISNAWKFTAKVDKPRIRVGVDEDDGGRRVFFVSDNGAGFDMRYKDRLFVPFQRLHSCNDFNGSGIGLAIVGRVIARHGGRIWAEGEPGGGAVFRFTLPPTSATTTATAAAVSGGRR
jgi:PAS domain S-box-containing protein